ncbi:hypothetical protein Tco_0715384 [Tanacetum coccineum]
MVISSPMLDRHKDWLVQSKQLWLDAVNIQDVLFKELLIKNQVLQLKNNSKDNAQTLLGSSNEDIQRT